MEFLSQDRELISEERYSSLSDHLTKILEDIDEANTGKIQQNDFERLLER